MTWREKTIEKGAIPLWFQIANILRDSIAAGEFYPGEILPTEAELFRVFGVSRTTARASLNKLMQEGLVDRRSGVGSVLVEPKVDQPVSQLLGFSEDMKRRGLVPSFILLRANFHVATEDVTEALGLASGDMPFMLERLLKANGRLIGHSLSWIRPDIFGTIEPPGADILESASLYGWLSKNLGIDIVGGNEFIEAQIAGDQVIEKLQISKGDAVLVAKRTAKAAQGLPIEFAVVTYRADRYRFSIDL